MEHNTKADSVKFVGTVGSGYRLPMYYSNEDAPSVGFETSSLSPIGSVFIATNCSFIFHV